MFSRFDYRSNPYVYGNRYGYGHGCGYGYGYGYNQYYGPSYYNYGPPPSPLPYLYPPILAPPITPLQLAYQQNYLY